MKPQVHFLFDSSNGWIRPWLQPLIREGDFSQGSDADMATGFDVLFILGYTKIIPPEILVQNGLNLVIHESDLPKGRGFSPVQWQVLAGASTIPVCMIEATAEADAGDIIARDAIELQGHELWAEIRELQAQATIRLIRRFLEGWPHYARTPQNGMASAYPRRRDKDDALDPDKTLREQFNQLRISSERFPAYFEIDGHRYIVRITRASS